MAYINRPFTKYTTYYIAGASPAAGIAQDAEIDCFDDANNRAGIIYFMADTMPLPPNQNTVNGIYLYYRTRRFADVMHILQTEKPLYLSLNTVNATGYVGTGFEPIGENE